MTKEIFMVESLWQQATGRSSSWGYEPIGYVVKEADAAHLTQQRVIGTGWPFERGHKMPKYRTVRLNLIQKPEDKTDGS